MKIQINEMHQRIEIALGVGVAPKNMNLILKVKGTTILKIQDKQYEIEGPRKEIMKEWNTLTKS